MTVFEDVPFFERCVKVEVAALGSLSLIVRSVSVVVKQTLSRKNCTHGCKSKRIYLRMYLFL